MTVNSPTPATPGFRLNSLFSGGGTFDHGARLAGWDTVSLCEFDEDAQDILTAHHPRTPLHPDIRALNGADLPDAELVMGGSPCQSLSAAGKRAGIRIDSLSAYLAHRDDPALQAELSASSLYWEMVRVIKEKHAATRGTFPRFVLWENVPGAFSSSGGEDFRIVLSGFLGRDVPLPRSGRWQRAGVVRGNGREIAWRTLDSQHFGVPQRRNRIFLVVDLAGQRAHEILLESHGVPGHPAPRAGQGQDTPAPAHARPDVPGEPRAVDCRNLRVTPLSGTLQAKSTGGQSLNYVNPVMVPSEQAGQPLPIPLLEVSKRTGVSTTDARCGLGIGSEGDVMYTLQASAQHGVAVPAFDPARALLGKSGWRGDGESDNEVVTLPEPLAFHLLQDPISTPGITPCLSAGNSEQGQASIGVAFASPAAFDLQQITSAANRSRVEPDLPAPTLAARSAMRAVLSFQQNSMKGTGTLGVDEDTRVLRPVKPQGDHQMIALPPAYAVRRLTPIECERLQALPDDFTLVTRRNGKPMPDSARYRICGNGGTATVICWLLTRMSSVLVTPAPAPAPRPAPKGTVDMPSLFGDPA